MELYGDTSRCAIPPLPEPLRRHSSTVVNGTTLSCGGVDSSGSAVPNCHRMTGGRWTTAPSLPQSLYLGQLVAMNGTSYFLGGSNRDGDPVADIYQLPAAAGGHWSRVGKLREARYYHCVTTTDTLVVITGGRYGGTLQGGTLSTVEMYRPGEARARRVEGDMMTARFLHGCTSYTSQDDRKFIIVAGGAGVSTVERAIVGRWRWEVFGNLPGMDSLVVVLEIVIRVHLKLSPFKKIRIKFFNSRYVCLARTGKW